MNTHLEIDREAAASARWWKDPAWIWAGRLAALSLIVFSILFLRRPDSLTNPQFWAEDGANFFAEQVRLGFWGTLVYPHNGYLHTVPRLIAEAASVLPVAWIPLSYNFCALVISSLCLTAFALPCCRNLIASDGLRAAACLVASAGVYCGDEMVANLTNLQWYFGAAALVLIFHERDKTNRRSLDVALAFLGLMMALTAPLLFILVPWLVWRAVRQRGLGKLPPGAMLAGLALQLHFMLRANVGHMHIRFNTVFFGIVGAFSRFNTIFLGTLGALISRPILTGFLGRGALIEGSDVTFMVELIILLILTTIWITALFLTISRARRRVLLGALCIGVLAVLFPLMGRNLVESYTTIWLIRNTLGERYFFFSSYLLVFLAAFSIESWWVRGRTSLKAAALVTLFGYGIVSNFNVPAYRDLSWPSYAPRIEQWISDRKHGKHVQPLTIPINPPDWSMTLTEK